MALINITTPSDGETADAADVATPLNTIVSEFNGNIDNANIKSGAAIATAKLASDEGIINAMIADAAITPEKLLASTGTTWAWQSWTPTLSGRFDDADWTKTCKYVQIGKTVHCRVKLVASAAAPMGGGTSDCVLSLPVTAVDYASTNSFYHIGVGALVDTGTSDYYAVVGIKDTTTAVIRILGTASTYAGLAGITSTVPFTWTTNDEIYATFTYEAA